MSRVPVHLASFILLAMVSFFAPSAAADPPWQWRYNASQTNYPTKGAALAAMHASTASAHLFTKERLFAVQDGSITYQYKAPPTSPEIKSDWRYTHGSVGGQWTSETAIVAQYQQQLQNAATDNCPQPVLVPDGAWVDSNPYYGGIATPSELRHRTKTLMATASYSAITWDCSGSISTSRVA